MKIGVIGAGRLGLTFALLCEKNGYEVLYKSAIGEISTPPSPYFV